MTEKNRRYMCNCCGYDYSHEEGLNAGQPSEYERDGKKIVRRRFECPMCGAPKRYADTYLA